MSYSAGGTDPKVKTPVFVTTTQSYDLRGLVVSTQKSDPGGGAVPLTLQTAQYDALGRQTSVTDLLGRVTGFSYDSAGHKIVTTQVDPDGGGIQQASISYASYDGDGNQVGTADSFGHSTWNFLDGLNRTIQGIGTGLFHRARPMPRPHGSLFNACYHQAPASFLPAAWVWMMIDGCPAA